MLVMSAVVIHRWYCVFHILLYQKVHNCCTFGDAQFDCLVKMVTPDRPIVKGNSPLGNT